MRRKQPARNDLREPNPETAATDDEVDLVAQELAEVVRNSMRAAASMSPTSPTHQATQHLVNFAERMAKGPRIEPFRLMSRVVEFLEPDDTMEQRLMGGGEAARAGTQLFLELSASDGFAGGRVSQRERVFMDAIRALEAKRFTARLGRRKRPPA